MPNYLTQTLPVPVLGSFGQTVSLSSILTTEFGPGFGGYAEFYLSNFDESARKKFEPDLGYWTGAAGTMTQWLHNGTPTGATPLQQNSDYTPHVDINASNVVHVSASDVDQYSLQIGSNIAPFSF